MLRLRLERLPDTLQDFELAAEEKYWEGCELLSTRYPGGGIYLLGYVAEMVLKHAAFRVQGHAPATPVGPLLGPARTWMSLHYSGIAPESYHSLTFWTYYLRGQRAALGRPLPAAIDAQLARRVSTVYTIWWVSMRYRPDQAQPAEATAMYDDVTWLRDHRVLLWS